jgi:hypothetical protein
VTIFTPIVKFTSHFFLFFFIGLILSACSISGIGNHSSETSTRNSRIDVLKDEGEVYQPNPEEIIKQRTNRQKNKRRNY